MNTTLPPMQLAVVMLPVADVDRSKAFYEQAGFTLDHDVRPDPNGTMRVVQFTPIGSSCSIVFGAGMPEISEITPGSVKGLHLVVADIQATHQALSARGIQLGDIHDMGGIKFASFHDPDGNSWLLQEIPAPQP